MTTASSDQMRCVTFVFAIYFVHINRIKCRRLKANVSGCNRIRNAKLMIYDGNFHSLFHTFRSRSMHSQACIYPDPSISLCGNYYYCPQIDGRAAKNLWKFSVWAITITLKVWVHTKHVQHKYKLRLNNCTMNTIECSLAKQIVKWKISYIW